MTEELKKFIEKAQQDEQLKKELEALEKTAAGKDRAEVRGDLTQVVIAIAKEHGCALTEEDFRPAEGQLDDAELTAVAGGYTGGCGCVVLGGGGGESKEQDVFVCACVLIGGSSASERITCLCSVLGVSG